MRKKALGIIAGVVLVAALGAAAFFLLKNQPEDSSADTSSSEESSAVTETLTSQEPKDVTSIDITNPTGSFEIVRTQEATDTDDAVYALSGYEDLPVDTKINTLANNTASLSTTGLVEENSSDLKKFGLDDAEATAVTLHFADGSSYAFRVGNAVSGTENTYLAPADSDTVYTVKTSLVSNFKNTADSFLSLTMLEKPSDDDMPIINTFTLERKDMDYVMELDYSKDAENDEKMGGTSASHEMVSPIPAYLSVDRSTPVITGVFGLKAASIAVKHPTDADMEADGLTDPFGTVTMACDDGNTYVLKFGTQFKEKDEETGTESAYYYAYLDGVNAIYKIAASDMVWATVTPTDITSKLVFGTYVWDVKTLNVTVDGGKSFQFQVEGSDKDSAKVTLNGSATDSERYRTFYSFLLNTTAETVDLSEKPEGDPIAEIQLETQDGTFSRDLAFYAIDDFTCLITVDGQSAYTCRKSFLDVLRKNMDIYDTDQEFTTNWS